MPSLIKRRAPLLAALAILLVSFSVQASEAKLIVPADTPVPASLNAQLLADYGTERLYRVERGVYEQWSRSESIAGLRKLSNPDWLLFDAQPFDTQTDRIRVPAGWERSAPTGRALQMVQFVGPIKQAWLDEVEATGATLVHYVANHGYLVWADAQARSQLNALASQRAMLQFSAPYPAFFKMGPVVAERLSRDAGETRLPVTIQMIRHANDRDTKAFIDALAGGSKPLMDWSPVMGFQTARFELSLTDLAAIADRSDVYWMEEFLPRERTDEVQNQIVAGNFNGDQSGPSGTGYLAWLSGLGFSTTTSDYPTVVIVDDGVGDGTVNSGDPTLHEGGDISNPTRLQFVTSCHSVSSGEGEETHGHINTSIVGGFDARSGFPFEDPNGFQRGQGINPWASLASTRIFAPGFSVAGCGGTDTGVIEHTWNQGARISTNSWGCAGCAGSYDDGSQAYDVGVRDADPSDSVNQELMILFAAGNSGSGSGTVGTPGNGKNMLTVGASENQRPEDEDGPWTDGCGVPPSGADNAMDVINFSSRGPAPGGRVKPETIAPGTHIQGTASTSPNFNGGGVCDGTHPSGQSVFAASSGTSHSTPAVAGVASLVWWWLENDANVLPIESPANPEPSPALIKAYILAHPTYLTGVSAGDTLPSNVQGYGMPNLSDMFDDTPKATVNQDVLFDDTGDSWEISVGVVDPAKPVRVMMVYTDQAGAIGTSPQVNDLNLTVQSGADTYLGNSFDGQWSVTGGSADSSNNYEAVFLEPGTATGITITVSAANIAGDGVPNTGDGTDQDFALVCSNCVLEPTFTVSAEPSSLAICTPDDAEFAVTIGSIEGFVDPVDLAVVGNPVDTTVDFDTDPVTPPGSSTLTIGNTGAAVAGSYAMTLSGTSGATVRETMLDLIVATATADAPSVSSPVDGATGIATQPLIEWGATDQASDYMLEIATDAAFSNVVYSVTISAASHAVSSSLAAGTEHFVRVRASNGCGMGDWSEVVSFTTVNEICQAPSVAIPDFDFGSGTPGQLTSDMVVANTGSLAGMELDLDITHTWVGDLILTLTHVDSGTSIELVSRADGASATFGCNANNIRTSVADGAPVALQADCDLGGTDQEAYPDAAYSPNQPLATFAGEDLSGTWRLDISDNAGGDTGTLNSWCMRPTVLGPLIFQDRFED